MRLLVLRSLWTNGFNLEAALEDCRSGEFDGVEGPLPSQASQRAEFLARLQAEECPFVAEIVTGGDYVPQHTSLQRHLDEFGRTAEASIAADPLFLTVLAGSDAWSLAESVEFFGRALTLAKQIGVMVSFETHRSRPTFNPWVTRELLRQLPTLRLTSDFSHWCCVCERLVMDEDTQLLSLCAQRTHHVHARVGYAQGPQVPHPAAPEYARALAAHERWWAEIWASQAKAGRTVSTLTPEFGPDGYLQSEPFTQQPLADLNEVNRWMARRQKKRFNHLGASVVPL